MRGTTALLAALAAVALTTPASAAPRTLLVNDPRGDANGANDQGLVDDGAEPSVTTEPASYAAGDILSLRLATTYTKRRATGLSITLTLAAPPADGSSYEIHADVPGCSWLHIWYDRWVGSEPATQVNCGDVGWAAAVPPARVSGSRITWNLPFRSTHGWIKAGTVLEGIDAVAWVAEFVPLPAGSPVREVGARPVQVDGVVAPTWYYVG